MLQPQPPESACPINVLMEIISAKWTVEIMRELALQPTRTRKFLLHIPGLSMKTLSRRLHSLESAGLVNRREFEGKPIKVEYSLTENGAKLCAILEQLKILQQELNSSCLKCKCSLEKECFAKPDLLACPHRRSRRPKANG
jgi:DNA-binding HxlR family transcriptional regulator